jgi:hypothetical protein
MQTQLLRDAVLERPLHAIAVPTRPRRAVRRSAAGALGASLAAAAAALLVLTPATQQGSNPLQGTARQSATVDPALVVFAANPTPESKIEVPRLKVEPATVLDGPARGRFSLPV